MKSEQEMKSETLLRQMADFIAEGHALGAEQERLEDEIRAAGIDPARFLTQFRAFVEDSVQQELGKQRRVIHEQRVRVQARLEQLHGKIAEMVKKWDSKMEEQWLARLDPQFAGVYHRNFKGAGTVDKASMMEEIELLEQLEKIIRDEEQE